MQLVLPALGHLPSYRAALERGWSPDNIRKLIATREELAAIGADPALFVERMVDREAAGARSLFPADRRPRGYRIAL